MPLQDFHQHWRQSWSARRTSVQEEKKEGPVTGGTTFVKNRGLTCTNRYTADTCKCVYVWEKSVVGEVICFCKSFTSVGRRRDSEIYKSLCISRSPIPYQYNFKLSSFRKHTGMQRKDGPVFRSWDKSDATTVMRGLSRYLLELWKALLNHLCWIRPLLQHHSKFLPAFALWPLASFWKAVKHPIKYVPSCPFPVFQTWTQPPQKKALERNGAQ